ncbi:MAG: ribosome-associated translation inhibitor RaiA [Holosporales bacterium]|jgi:ribosomal subunit interface protein|nr:ribosome-associated translation inhibitor RaiA [Holosporales bacterium]
MDVKITGDGIDLGSSLREHIADSLSNLMKKYLEEDVASSVTIKKDSRLFEVGAELRVHKGFIIRSNGESQDVYAAVDSALSRLVTLLSKHKNRLLNKHRRKRWDDAGNDAVKYVLERKLSTSDEIDEEHLVIAECDGYVLALSVSEAVMKLDLTDAPVVMFKNAESGRVNVVYKKQDGNIGWIDYKE